MRFSSKLSDQLLTLIVIIFVVFFLTLGIILPQVVIPTVEKNVYNYLREPLEFIQADIDEDLITTEIAYLYKFGDTLAYSENIRDIIKIKNIGCRGSRPAWFFFTYSSSATRF